MTRTDTRTGYTLVELLVVIAIIGILAALTTAAVQNARGRGKDTECRADLSGLNSAVANFRAKMGCPVPGDGGGTNSAFRLRTDYSAATWDNSKELRMLLRMFPRMSRTNNGLPAGTSVDLDPNQCLVFFLSGSTYTNYNGFATDPAQPFKTAASAAEARLNGSPFFEFKPNRMSTSNTPPRFLDPWGNPYLYFSSENGNDYLGAAFTAGTFNGIQPFFTGSGATKKFRNDKSHQIVSAGPDGKFGPGGNFTAGSGSYADNKDGGDDFANFAQFKLSSTQ